jgi:hypothetical protein
VATLPEDRDLALELLLEMILDDSSLWNNLAGKRLTGPLVDRKPHDGEAAVPQAVGEDRWTDLVRGNQALVAD